MAKVEREINGDFYELISRIERGIMKGSLTASLENFSHYIRWKSGCAVYSSIHLVKQHFLTV